MSEIYISLAMRPAACGATGQVCLDIAAVAFQEQGTLQEWTLRVAPRSHPHHSSLSQLPTDGPSDAVVPIEEAAESLRLFVGEYPLVGYQIENDIAALTNEGIVLSNPQMDIWEIARILLPTWPDLGFADLAGRLGISVYDCSGVLDLAAAGETVFLALCARARELELPVLVEANRLASNLDWPLKQVFREAERWKVKNAFVDTGATASRRNRPAKQDAWLRQTANEQRGAPQHQSSLEPKSVDGDALAAVLAPGGLLSAHMEGYEYRPQQEQMMRAVAEAFSAGQRLVVEAGTGVGKSLAYLLPASAWAVQNNCRVVVSTNTINLQEQLYAKDVPSLQAVVPFCFSAALLKGRSNYLCERRWLALRRSSLLSRDETLMAIQLLVWLAGTVTGDVAELSLSEEQRLAWGRVSAYGDECAGNQCPHFQRGLCFLFRAREEAEAAHIVIVNHSLLLADLVASRSVVPQYEHLVVDEAHNLEDEATRQFGFEINERDLRIHFESVGRTDGSIGRGSLLSDLASALASGHVPVAFRREFGGIQAETEECLAEIRCRTQALWAELAAFVEETAGIGEVYGARLRITPSTRAQPGWTNIEILWDGVASIWAKLESHLGSLAAVLGQMEGQSPSVDDALAGLAGVMFAGQEVRQNLNNAFVEPTEDYVYWVSVGPDRARFAVSGAPLEVAPLLDKALFSKKAAVVLTSATLAVGGRFDFVRERLGFWDSEELLLGSPFDFGQAVEILVPLDLPDPDRPHYLEGVSEALVLLVAATQGRSLALFTSHNHLRQVYRLMRDELEREGIKVLAQGIDGSPAQLLQRLKLDPRAVVLGTSSFWEGVDVVGEALSVLVIARLPFPVPSDPLTAARCEMFENPFDEYSVPQAVLRFRQGFGRLIRSGSDRGVAVVLDRRVVTKSYGRRFLRSLPSCRTQHVWIRDLGKETERWLAVGSAESLSSQ